MKEIGDRGELNQAQNLGKIKYKVGHLSRLQINCYHPHQLLPQQSSPHFHIHQQLVVKPSLPPPSKCSSPSLPSSLPALSLLSALLAFIPTLSAVLLRSLALLVSTATLVCTWKYSNMNLLLTDLNSQTHHHQWPVLPSRLRW